LKTANGILPFHLFFSLGIENFNENRWQNMAREAYIGMCESLTIVCPKLMTTLPTTYRQQPVADAGYVSKRTRKSAAIEREWTKTLRSLNLTTISCAYRIACIRKIGSQCGIHNLRLRGQKLPATQVDGSSGGIGSSLAICSARVVALSRRNGPLIHVFALQATHSEVEKIQKI
jgi:hypothetical protein